jgi:hypothetical protein
MEVGQVQAPCGLVALLYGVRSMIHSKFYTELPSISDFDAMAQPETYTPLPDDWVVGTSDIVGSTKAVADGRYKTVNMIGAAVISAQINEHGAGAFPYVFGGDGAGFAVPPEWAARAGAALSAVRTWADEEFGMELRVGLIPVAEIRAAGQDVSVARYQVSDGVDYAMFTGGGVSWAEDEMKAGRNDLEPAPAGTRPDLEGLSCRWNHMPSRNGTILSLVILPQGAAERFAETTLQVVQLAQGLHRAGHPAPEDGPGATWPGGGAALEAHAQRGAGSLRKAKLKALFESLMAKILLVTGIKLGGFDARRYQRVVGENADFRKFDDGLKMTLDCDAETDRAICAALDQAVADGVLRYGVHRQNEAMMTCIVPSILTDDHVHFVDGAAGGYTAAASTLKG